ncbi:hypothetical protein KKB18_08600, partial [bacterium]|nr:hypothetical protein [bacterium]
KIAKKIVDMQMAVPAIMFLESVKPLNFIGSQAMAFLQPFATAIFTLKDYDKFRIILEDRRSIEALICHIEDMEDKRRIELKEHKRKLKEEKQLKKEERKKRKELRKNAS